MLLIKPQQLKKVAIITFSLWLLAAVAVLWIDKSLALLIHANGLDNLLLLRNLTEWLPAVMTILVLFLIFFYYWTGWRLFSIGIAVYFYLTLQLTMEIKVGLKIIFGRYWPETWLNHNLSLIHDGVFGFDWWHGFANQGSFPSGHSTYIAFCCVWLLIIAPRFRYAWYLIIILVLACLIILDYHFLGDCLAGIGLGYLCSFVSLYWLQRYWPKIIQEN